MYHFTCVSVLSMYVCLSEICVSGVVRDKAGGYGIQALGGMLVEYVHGDFLNVVGFPLNHFCKQLDLIYNKCTFSSDQESLPVAQRQDGTDTTSVVTQPEPNPEAQFGHSSSSSAKHNLPPGPTINHPSASQTPNNQKSPSASSVHKVSVSHPMSTVEHFFVVISNSHPS